MPRVVLRPAVPAEAGALSDLALRSKGHWGYDAVFLATCRDELTIHPEQCDGIRIRVAERAGTLVGFYQLSGIPPQGELTGLFVDPPVIGQGVGTLLLDDALRCAREMGLSMLAIDADPNAEVFYLRAGAVRIGTVPSGSVVGRVLPRLELPTGPTTHRCGVP